MRLLKHNPEKVALVGMGPSVGAMFNECLTQEFQPSWADEVWAINMASNLVWHDIVWWMDDLDSQEKFKPALFSALRRRGKPVITTVANREILPKSYDYPIDAATAVSMPIFGKPYFNNGVAMAVAYAMVKRVKTLKMYGCDFTYPDRNYAESGRACTEAWMALASASGMEIILPEKTSLFDAIESHKGVYGYAEQPVITLPNGRLLGHDGSQTAAPSKETYTPEDSSGLKKPRRAKKNVKKELTHARNVHGANGTAAPVAGPAHA